MGAEVNAGRRGNYIRRIISFLTLPSSSQISHFLLFILNLEGPSGKYMIIAQKSCSIWEGSMVQLSSPCKFHIFSNHCQKLYSEVVYSALFEAPAHVNSAPFPIHWACALGTVTQTKISALRSPWACAEEIVTEGRKIHFYHIFCACVLCILVSVFVYLCICVFVYLCICVYGVVVCCEEGGGKRWIG